MPPAHIHADPDLDLAPFAAWLAAQGIEHRIYRESHAQVVELAEPGRMAEARKAFADWRSGRLRIERLSKEPAKVGHTPRRGLGPPGGPMFWLRATPAVCVLILVAWLAFFAIDWVFPWFTFVPPERIGAPESALEELAQLRVWRWVTPILLHFGALHIVFNSLVVFELGRRVELRAGAPIFIALVVAIALVSNVAQFLVSVSTPFGGLSGVAYGLLGAVLVAARLAPQDPIWRLPNGIAGGLLVFLVLFSTGITEHLGDFSISVANTAHWTGLAAGAIAGVGLARLRRPAPRPAPPTPEGR